MEKSRPKIDAGDIEFFSGGFRFCGVEGGCSAVRVSVASVFAVFVAPAPGTDWRRGEKEQFDVRVMLF